MSDLPTMSASVPAIRALAQMATDLYHLPQARFAVVDLVTPHGGERLGRGIAVSVYTADAFEAWRTALRILPSEVTLGRGGAQHLLRATATFAGVPVELSAFLPAQQLAAAA